MKNCVVGKCPKKSKVVGKCPKLEVVNFQLLILSKDLMRRMIKN